MAIWVVRAKADANRQPIGNIDLGSRPLKFHVIFLFQDVQGILDDRIFVLYLVSPEVPVYPVCC